MSGTVTTLRIDLDPAVGPERIAQDAPMLGQRVGISRRAQFVKKLRRALRIGEEEGDGAGREIAPHDDKCRRCAWCRP